MIVGNQHCDEKAPDGAKVLYARDCPMVPKPGAERFPLTVPLNTGKKLRLVCGREDIINLAASLLCLLQDDPELAKEVHEAMIDVEIT